VSYWLSVFSPETWAVFCELGCRTAGLPKWARLAATRLKIDDVLVCYVSRHSRWVGAARITGTPVIDHRPLFTDDRDRYIVRVPVEPIAVLSSRSGLPIRSVWDSLIRTRSIVPGSPGWTYKAHLNQAIASMHETDGEFLVRRLTDLQLSGDPPAKD
jgi:hypothetical protein